MARYTIYAKGSTTTVRAKGGLKYNGVFGGVSYVEFTEIASPTPIDWQIGDYVDYARTGLRYALKSIPSVDKQARSNTYGGAYVYRNVQFFAATRDLQDCPFQDVVLGDNTTHFSSAENISTYENVGGIARRIQACLNDMFPASNWVVSLYTGDSDITAYMSEPREFAMSSGQTCLDALNQIYTIWKGIGWVHTYNGGVNTILIGRPNKQDALNTTSPFLYGKGNGLTLLKRSVSTANEMATRLYPFGSTENMISRYYNGNSSIKDYQSVHIPNLMIPVTRWGQTGGKYDPKKAYVENASMVAKYGLKPKVVRFTGGDYEEIKPSIEGMTAGNLRNAMPSGAQYRPSSRYTNNERLDEIKSASNPYDSGLATDNDGVQYIESGSVSGNRSPVPYSFMAGQSQIYVTLPSIATFAISHTGDVRVDFNLQGTAVVNHSCESISVKAIVKLAGEEVTSRELEVKDGGFSLPTVKFKADTTGSVSIDLAIYAKIGFAGLFSGTLTTGASVDGTYGIAAPITNQFTLTLKQIGFDISKQGSSLSDGLAVISMKSGACGGRNFTVKRVVYNSATDDWTCTCVREQDTALGQYFPNATYPVSAGDRFVITDMEMPEVYLLSASQKLYDKAVELLGKMSKPKFVYEPQIDAIVMARSPETITEGMYMAVEDSDIIGGREFVLINTLTIDEVSNPIPTFSVALRDEKFENTFQKITGEVSNVRKSVTDIEEGASKKPYDDPFEGDGSESEDKILTIESPTDMFLYEEGAEEPTEDKIVLTAVLKGFDGEVEYQWYYDEDGVWTPLSGATSQGYAVLPSGEDLPYFQDGDGAETFRCVVSLGTDEWYADKTIVKVHSGTSGYSCFSDNTSHIFAGTETSAVGGQSDRINLYLYKGIELIPSKIGTVTGQETGLTATIHDNNTNHPYISVAVTDALTTDGVLSIPVYDGDRLIATLKYSWSIQKKGEKGEDGEDGQPGTPGTDGTDGYNTCIVYLYKRSATTPTIDWTQSLDYSFSEKRITSAAPTGWSKTIPSGAETLYVTAATALSRTDVDTIAYTEWAAPVEFSKNGLNTATVFLFKRSATALTRSDLPTADLTYTFASGLLTPSSGLRGWSQSVPSGSDPCYITQATALSVSDTDIIEGGTGGDWSTPLKFVQDGERGLQGAAIRGPQDWDNLFPQGETHSYRFSSGKPDVEITDANFLDLAYDSADEHYYMCKLSYTATQSSPRPSADPTHWYQADAQYEFIATRVLLATSAKIKFLSGNEILLMYGNNVTGGAKGAATANDIVFWAGASGSTDDPLSGAPYRVTRGGKLYATDAAISGTITAKGSATTKESKNYSIDAQNGIFCDKRFFAYTGASDPISGLRYRMGIYADSDEGEVAISAPNKISLTTNSGGDIVARRSPNEAEENILLSPDFKRAVKVTEMPRNPVEGVIYFVI